MSRFPDRSAILLVKPVSLAPPTVILTSVAQDCPCLVCIGPRWGVMPIRQEFGKKSIWCLVPGALSDALCGNAGFCLGLPCSSTACCAGRLGSERQARHARRGRCHFHAWQPAAGSKHECFQQPGDPACSGPPHAGQSTGAQCCHETASDSARLLETAHLKTTMHALTSRLHQRPGVVMQDY